MAANNFDMRTYIEFIGGDMDGRILDSESTLPSEPVMIAHIFHTTDGGKVGKKFHGMSQSMVEKMILGDPTAMVNAGNGKSHMYEVIDCSESNSERRIKLKYSVRNIGEKP